MTREFWKKTENIFVSTCLVFSALGFVFINMLVGPPKMLFGKPLTTITPTSFPSIILGALTILCIADLYFSNRHKPDENEVIGLVGLQRGGVFFGIMAAYGLLMVPIGFTVSSTIALAVLSWFVGNRSFVQIVLVSALAPVLLYLAATRLLAVSLPELNAIELALSKLLGG